MKYLSIGNFRVYFFQSLGAFSVQFLGFILGIIIIRVSGIELMGQYAAYIALINLSFGVLSSGLYTNYLRSNNTSQFGSTFVGLTILFTFFLCVLSQIYHLITGDSYINIILILISFYFMKLSELYVVTTRFENNDKLSILPRIIPYTIVIILCIIIKPKNIGSLLMILTLGWLTASYFIFKSIRIIKFNKTGITKVLSTSIVLSATTLTTQIYGNVDQLMIANLFDYGASGSYKIGVSFSVLAMPIIGVFSFIYISEIKKLIDNSKFILIKNTFYNQLKINFALSFMFFVFCYFFLSKIIYSIYGIQDNGLISNIGIVLSLGVIFNVLAMVISFSLLAINKDRLIFIVSLFGAACNILLNYYFIRMFGVIGGAWASVLTHFFIFIIYVYIFFVKLNFFKYLISNK